MTSSPMEEELNDNDVLRSLTLSEWELCTTILSQLKLNMGVGNGDKIWEAVLGFSRMFDGHHLAIPHGLKHGNSIYDNIVLNRKLVDSLTDGHVSNDRFDDAVYFRPKLMTALETHKSKIERKLFKYITYKAEMADTDHTKMWIVAYEWEFHRAIKKLLTERP